MRQPASSGHMRFMETDTKMKRPRGRPPILAEGQLMTLEARFPDDSHRTRMNLVYADAALNALNIDSYGRHHPLRWLTHDRDGNRAPKQGILTELGRLLHSHGLETMARAAKELCEIKPTVKDGAAKLRRLRLGKQPGASAEGLANALWKSFCTYRATHDEISEADAVHAVEALADQVAKVYVLASEPAKN